LNYTRYNNEIFTEILGKDGFVSLPYNMSVLYVNYGRNWIRSLGLYGRLCNFHINTTLLHIHYTDKHIFSFSHVLDTTHIFLRGFAFFLVAGICLKKCNSLSFLGGGSIYDQPYTG
jgi:hypothetical protein